MGRCSLVWSLTFGLFVLIASLSATGSNSTHTLTFYHSHIQLCCSVALLHLQYALPLATAAAPRFVIRLGAAGLVLLVLFRERAARRGSCATATRSATRSATPGAQSAVITSRNQRTTRLTASETEQKPETDRMRW